MLMLRYHYSIFYGLNLFSLKILEITLYTLWLLGRLDEEFSKIKVCHQSSPVPQKQNFFNTHILRAVGGAQ